LGYLVLVSLISYITCWKQLQQIEIFYVLKCKEGRTTVYAVYAIGHIVPIYVYTVFTARSCSREGRDRPLAKSCL